MLILALSALALAQQPPAFPMELGCWPQIESNFPSQDGQQVPTNAAIRFILQGNCNSERAQYTLTVDDGATQPTLVSTDSNATFLAEEEETTVVVYPDEPLLPFTRYRVQVFDEDSESSELRFTTGEGPSDAAADVRILSSEASAECTGRGEALFAVVAQIASEQEGWVGQYDLDVDPGIQPITSTEGLGQFNRGIDAALGLDSVCLSIRSFRIDGTFTEWEETCLAVEDIGDCREPILRNGCGSDDGDGVPGPQNGLVFLPFTLLLRRRRRTH